MPKKVSGKKAGSRKPRLSPSGYQLPDPIKAGEILTDTVKKQWRLGTSIGTGGFGEIYRASDDVTKAVPADAEYVIKIEPHSNGPLFAEMHFYLRVAKADMISNWMEKKKVKFLGMPKFVSNGSHDYKGNKYRFMVMERFGDDLQKLFEAGGKRLLLPTILSLAIKILDILEYIHHAGYVHADIKGSNLLRGPTQSRKDEVYLVDFGLACRYINGTGEHKEYKEDPRKAHDGTIEFTSRDAHIGAHSRRGDLEILGYNILQWLCCKLPWEDNLKDQNYVQDQKERYMKDISLLLKACFKKSSYPDCVEKYLKYVAALKFTEEPNYDLCRSMFRSGLKSAGYPDNGKLEFAGEDKASPASRPKGKIRKKAPVVPSDDEEDEQSENLADRKPAKAPRSSPCQPCRPAQTNRMRRLPKSVSPKVDEKPEPEISTPINPTPAMLEILERMRQKNNKRKGSSSATRVSANTAADSVPIKKKKMEAVRPTARKRRTSRSPGPVKYERSPDLF